MSLKEVRRKNRKQDSFIYSKVEHDIPKEVAEAIKKDVFYGFIEPVGQDTLRRYGERFQE